MTARKPWRIDIDGEAAEHLTSQDRAYEAVRWWTDRGHPVTVMHWEDRQWRLYERIDAAPKPERKRTEEK